MPDKDSSAAFLVSSEDGLEHMECAGVKIL